MQYAHVFQSALPLFQQGLLQEALAALSKAPIKAADFDIQHLRAAIYASLGEYEHARACFNIALSLQPKNYPLRYNLAKLEKLAGHLESAEKLFLTLHQEQSTDAEVSNELGAMALARNDLTAAENYLRKAIAVRPGFTSAIINLAGVAVLRSQFDAALALLAQADELDNPRVQLQTGGVLLHAGRFIESKSVFENLVNTAGFNLLSQEDIGRFYINYGCVLVELGETEQGKTQYLKASQLAENDCFYYINLATFHYKVEQNYSAAEALFLEALSKFTGTPDLHDMYAVFLQHKGEYANALPHHLLALSGRPDYEQFVYNLAMTEMALGQLDTAWDHYESRWIRPEVGEKPDLNIPEWQGESGEGKSILVYREQGLGDEIMWATCLPDLAQEFNYIVYSCHPKLTTLFSRTYPEVAVIPNRVPRHPMMLGHFDYQVSIASLPRFFRRNKASFPLSPRLMQDDPIRTQHWRQRLQGVQPNLIVGLAWRSGYVDAIRDIHYLALDDLAPLLALPNVQFINLQYHLSEAEKKQLDADFPGKVVHAYEIDLFDDLDATACLMKACDLIIAPCTSTLMQAGALGIPALYLLALQQDSWLLGERFQSPWFPSSTVLAKEVESSWQVVIEQACLILLQLAKEKIHALP